MRAQILLAVLLFTATTGAPTGSIHFDDLATGSVESGTLRFVDVDGTGIDVVVSGPALQIRDLYKFGGNANFDGNALITWMWPQDDGISFQFSRPVSQVGVAAGDFGGDDDGPLRLRALDCDGQILAEATAAWEDGRNPPFEKLTVEARDICQVVFTSGGLAAGSAFVDDVVFVP